MSGPCLCGAEECRDGFDEVAIPGLRIVSEMNAREFWAKKSERVKRQRETVTGRAGSSSRPARRQRLCRVAL